MEGFSLELARCIVAQTTDTRKRTNREGLVKKEGEKPNELKLLASFIITFCGIIIVSLLGALAVGYYTDSTENFLLTLIIGLIIACVFGFINFFKFWKMIGR